MFVVGVPDVSGDAFTGRTSSRTGGPGLLPDGGKFLPGDCDDGLLVTKEPGIGEIRRPRKARHRFATVGQRDDEDLLVDEGSSLPVSREDVYICPRQEV